MYLFINYNYYNLEEISKSERSCTIEERLQFLRKVTAHEKVPDLFLSQLIFRLQSNTNSNGSHSFSEIELSNLQTSHNNCINTNRDIKKSLKYACEDYKNNDKSSAQAVTTSWIMANNSGMKPVQNLIDNMHNLDEKYNSYDHNGLHIIHSNYIKCNNQLALTYVLAVANAANNTMECVNESVLSDYKKNGCYMNDMCNTSNTEKLNKDNNSVYIAPSRKFQLQLSSSVFDLSFKSKDPLAVITFEV
jgi:hypothetical protein